MYWDQGDVMNIIICVDKSNGMMFNNRRQSQDRQVLAKILEITEGARLLMSEYSYQMFSETVSNIIANNSFLSQAQDGDFCFIENTDMPTEKIESVFIFNWNRDYPADKYFTIDLKLTGFKKVKKEEFVGYSHKKITLEIYRRV